MNHSPLRSQPSLLFIVSCVSLLALEGMIIASRPITPSDTLFDLGFGFGEVVRAWAQGHTLAVPSSLGIPVYAARMPLIPLAAYLAHFLSTRLLVYFVLKNLVTWGLIAMAVRRLSATRQWSKRELISFTAVLALSPYALSIASDVNFEEGVLASLVLLLFAELVSEARPWVLAIVLAAIYLTKSSMLLVCLSSAGWMVAKEWPRLKLRSLIPAIGLGLAILSWGSYVYRETGVFAIGTHSTSLDGFNLHKGNNRWAFRTYPRTSLDTLDDRLSPATSPRNEWDFNATQRRLALDYMRERPEDVLHMDASKAFVFCCDVGEAPQHTPGMNRWRIVLSNVVDHLLLGGVILFTLADVFNRRTSSPQRLFLLLLVAYLLPYFAGFLYMRHMVPLYFLAVAMAMLCRRNDAFNPRIEFQENASPSKL